MNWIIFVIIAVIADPTRIFIDNYSSDVYFKGNKAVAQKLYYGYAAIIASIIILIVCQFNPTTVDPVSLLLLISSGVLSAIAGIAYFRALELDNSTNIGIFTQLAPVLYLILGWFFLGDSFSPIQLVAFAIILCAPFLIVLTTRKKSRNIRIKAVLFASTYVFIAVIGNLLFVKGAIDDAHFIISLAIMLLGKGIANVALVYAIPSWHKRFHTILKKSSYKVLRPLTINLVVSFIKEFSYRFALTSAPAVALASVASDSAEPIVIFFMGIVLTIIWPNFGREKLERKTVLVHLIATILVVIGIVLLQI